MNPTYLPLPPSWCLECKCDSGALPAFSLYGNEDRMVSWKECESMNTVELL